MLEPEEELDVEPHAPLVNVFTPAAYAAQLLQYVIPSQPQTELLDGHRGHSITPLIH